MVVRRVTRTAPTDDSSSEAEPEAPRSRFSRGKSEPAAPAGRRGRRAPSQTDDEADDGASHVSSGWGGYKHAKDTTPSRFDRPWKPAKDDDDEYLIKFLEDGPFATFKSHWVPYAPNQKGFICLEDECPLCEVGNTPSAKARFNILVSLPAGDDSEGDTWEWVQKTYESGITVTDTLAGYSRDPKIGPLSKGYFALSCSGVGQKRKTNIRPVKSRDVVDPDDWNTPEPTEAQMNKFEEKMLDKSSLGRTSRKDLDELADLASA